MKQTTHFTRFALIDPHDLDAYLAEGGFAGLRVALEGRPAATVRAVRDAKLAGRGGAGFDAGTKWSTVASNKEPFVVCNADEGEPGTFKDRYLLRTAPFLVLEGLIIAGYAVGAHTGYVYVRGEYPEVIASLDALVARLHEEGYLGADVLGSGFSFNVEIMRGGGSYVVGDETALLSSLMGERGYPLAKPPFPTQRGLWGEPTVINNVETLACVPLILANGSDWFAGIGAPACPGMKLYSVSGHVERPGVYEFPMGTTLAEILEAAGGVTGDLKAVQIGGTAGPVYDSAALEYPLDFVSMRNRGGSLGSGAIVVMNTSVSMVHALEVSMRFFSEESCGQCFACRYGTRQLEYMANRIAAGEGKPEYPRLMRETAEAMYDAAFCPFGQSIRLTLTTLLDAFGDEISASMAEQRYMKEVV
ncbi:MAG: complex I 51 kDa subunit family protein [Spirochaetota bacterium]